MNPDICTDGRVAFTGNDDAMELPAACIDDFDPFLKDTEGVEKNKKSTTTTLGFIFDKGIIVATSSQTASKIIDINPYILGVAGGGAADFQFWQRNLGLKFRHRQQMNKQQISVAGASKLLANILRSNGEIGISCGTTIAGWDATGPGLYYVDSQGARLKGTRFSVGPGYKHSHDILNESYSCDMSVEEASELARRALYHATCRDGAIGGGASVYHVGPDGWKELRRADAGEMNCRCDPVESVPVGQEVAACCVD